MPFRTRINLQDNRQHFHPQREYQAFSGITEFGVAFSAMTTGPNPSASGTSGSIINVISTFSGNTGTTVFTFGDPAMDLAQGVFSAITDTTSAFTQSSGYIFTGNTSQTLDGHLSYLDYTGVSFDIQVSAITETTPGIFTGTVVSDDVFFLTADTLDFTGRTIWSDVKGISRTNEIIITKNPFVGAVLTSDAEGKASWQPALSVDTHVTGFTYDNANTLTIHQNGGVSALTTTINEMTGLTVNGLFSADTISINGGEIMSIIPDSDDFRLFGNQTSTGAIAFQGLSANTFDNTKFDLGIVKGWVINNDDPQNPITTYIDYTGSTGEYPSGMTLTYLATFPVTYIGLSGETNSDVVQKSEPFTAAERRDIISLGVVVHSNNTNVEVINNLPNVVTNPMSQVYDLWNSIGKFNISGNEFTYNGTNLNINKSAGQMFAIGANFQNETKSPHILDLSSGSSITFRYRLQDSTEFSNTTVVDPNHYDNGGVTALTPTNKFTVQRINLFTSNITRWQYGQNIYDSIDDAEATISAEDFVIEQNIEQNGLLRGFLIVKQGATDLSNPKQAKFLDAATFGRAYDTTSGNIYRREILNQSSTGLREGGVISATTATQFAINAGSGIIIDNYTDPNIPVLQEIFWNDITGQTLTYLSGDVATFITINSDGNVVQYPLASPPNQEDKRNEIFLGAIAHSNLTTITNVYNAPIHITSPINQHEDFTAAVGPFNITGNFVSGIAGTLEMQKTGCEAYVYGGNFKNNNGDPSHIVCDFISGSSYGSQIVYATGTEILGFSGFSVDTNNYDPSGGGTITALPTNKYTAHRIWLLPINNILVFQYGQYEYNSLDLAIAGFSSEDYISTTGLEIGAYLVSVLITKQGTVNLANAANAKFVRQSKFAGVGGGGTTISTLQSSYDNSTAPQITTDATRGALELKNGAGSNTLNVFEVSNSGGTNTATIKGNGYTQVVRLGVGTAPTEAVDVNGNIQIADTFVLKSAVVGGELNLNDPNGPNGTWSITSDNGGYTSGSTWVYGQPSNGSQLAYQLDNSEAIGIAMFEADKIPELFTAKEIVIHANNAGKGNSNTGDMDKRAVSIGTRNSTFNAGVVNSVILGGSGLTANQDGTVYVSRLNINTVDSGTSITNLGIDSNGYVVSGTSGGGGVTIDPYENVGSATTITWDVSGTSTNYQVVLTGVSTVNLTNVRNGDYGTIIVQQDGVGSRTLSFGTVNGGSATHLVANGGGGAPTLTATANAFDILSFTYNGSTMFWTVGNDYT